MAITVVKDLVPESRYYLKCPFTMNPEFIVVHNTANDASAFNEVSYMKRVDKELSWHFAIDDHEVRQALPLNRNGWHAGDGGNGPGNRKGIGIEICWSKSGGDKFVAAEKLAAKFIAQLLKERGWGIDKVKKHQDFSAKYCPHRTLDMGWQRFLNMISAELNPPKTEAPASTTMYRVQVGAFTSKDNAVRYADKVREKGFDAYIVSVGNLYKIQVGAFGVKANAEAYLLKVQKAGFTAFLTTESGKAVATSSTPKKSITEIAKEVIAGKWGNGTDRKNRLTAAGYDYEAVQKKVNELI